MWRGWLLVTVAVLLCSPAGRAASSTGIRDHARTSQALSNLYALDQLNIEAGRLAATKGGTPEIRRFGDRLVRDHRFAQQRVEDDARRLGITIRQPGREPGTERRLLIRQLETLSGPRFDQAFLSTMEQSNKQAEQLLTATRANFTDGRMRSLLAGLVPIARQHQDLATILQSREEPKDEGESHGDSAPAGQ